MNHSRSDAAARRTHPWTPALLALAFVLFLAYLLRYVLLPFILAGALAFLSAPAVRFLHQRWRFPRWLAALLPFLLVLVVLAVIGLGIKAYVLPEATELLANQKAIIDRFTEKLLDGRTINIGGHRYGPRDISDLVLSSATSVFDPHQAMQALMLATGVVMGGVLTIVLLFYFLIDAPRVARGLIWVVPPRIRPQAAAVGRRAGPMLFAYVRGVIVVVAYAMLITFLVMRYVLHFQHAIVLAIAVGLLEIIPVIGPIIAIGLIGMVAIEQITFWNIIGVSLFAIGLRVSIDQLVGPVVLGRFVRVSPPLIIFAFLAGGTIYGAMGVFLAVPVAGVIKIILEEAYGEAEGGNAEC
jgi:predicted PurR-regulated permease PerM